MTGSSFPERSECCPLCVLFPDNWNCPFIIVVQVFDGNNLRKIISRIAEFDYARGMAIIGVLVIHTAMYGSLSANNGLLRTGMYGIDLVVRFSVPLFIFISGYLLSASYKKGFGIGTFLKRRACSVLIPYLLFSSIYLMMFRAYGRSVSLESALGSVVTGTGLYQLYFVILIMQLYLTYPLLMSVLDRAEGRLSTSAVLVCSVLLGFTSTILISLFGPNDPNVLTEGVGWVYFLSAPGVLFYFVFGMVAGRVQMKDAVLKDRRRLKIGMALFGAIGLYSVLLVSTDSENDVLNHVIYSLATITYCVLAIVLCMYISTRLAGIRDNIVARSLRSLGESSFTIFLVFMIANLGLIKALAMVGIGYDDWSFYALLFAGTLTISYLATRVIARTFISGVLFGRSFGKVNPRAVKSMQAVKVK